VAYPGLGVDAAGDPVVDPTQNVLNLVTAAIQRQDDLREAAASHQREMAILRADYDEKLRRAETARIDAIRAVDVGAVNRAAEVSAQQATTLAAQVATSAETLRTQVAAAASAATTALAGALEPIQKDIADLRKAQYEAQGVKTNVGETRLNLNTIFIGVSIVIAAVVAFVIR
jgi:CHAT domain-containing protein